MSDKEKLAVIQKRLLKIKELCELPGNTFCTAVTSKEHCGTHNDKWARIGSEASKALRTITK